MQHTMKHAILVAAASILLSPNADAQQWARKMFDRQKIDFGVIATGSDARQWVRIKNVYPHAVHISNVRTTCGCSAAEPEKTDLKPGEETAVEVTMNTVKFRRRKDSNVIVTFDRPQRAEVRVPITAYIRTDVVFEPGAAAFGSIEAGQAATRTITVAYAGRDDWKILDVKASSDNIEVEVTEVSRGNGQVSYKLDVHVRAGTPVGRVRQLITLVTDDSGSPNVPLLVEGLVEPDISVVPPLLALRTMRAGEQKTVRVVLRGKRPFEVEKVECTDHPECFQVKLPGDKRKVHVLPLRVTAPNEAGDFTDEFTVTVAGRPEPLTFRTTGTIVTQ